MNYRFFKLKQILICSVFMIVNVGIKANPIDSCNNYIYLQIDAYVKKVLSLDSLCNYVSNDDNHITFILYLDSNLNISEVDIFTKYQLTDYQLKQIKWQLLELILPKDCLKELIALKRVNPNANLRISYKPIRY